MAVRKKQNQGQRGAHGRFGTAVPCPAQEEKGNGRYPQNNEGNKNNFFIEGNKLNMIGNDGGGREDGKQNRVSC
jgi:hypothetical protein